MSPAVTNVNNHENANQTVIIDSGVTLSAYEVKKIFHTHVKLSPLEIEEDGI